MPGLPAFISLYQYTFCYGSETCEIHIFCTLDERIDKWLIIAAVKRKPGQLGAGHFVSSLIYIFHRGENMEVKYIRNSYILNCGQKNRKMVDNPAVMYAA